MYSVMIQSEGNGALSALKKTRERDLNMTLDDEQWDSVKGSNLRLNTAFTRLPPDCLHKD